MTEPLEDSSGCFPQVLVHLLTIGCVVWASSRFLPAGLLNLILVACVCSSICVGTYFFVRVFKFDEGDMESLSFLIFFGQSLLAAVVLFLTSIPVLIGVSIAFRFSTQAGKVTLIVSAVSFIGFLIYWSIVPSIFGRRQRK